MRVALDARVLSREGDEIGSMRRVIINPRTSAVSAFVVKTGGLLGHEVLIAVEEIDELADDGGAIRVRLSKEQFKDFPPYRPSEYVLPPSDTTAPSLAGFPYGSYLWPAAAPDATGVSEPAIPGEHIEPSGVVVATRLGRRTTVVDSHGEHLGVVDQVLFDDETERLMGFVLHTDEGDTVEVQGGLIAFVDEDRVQLSVDRDALLTLVR